MRVCHSAVPHGIAYDGQQMGVLTRNCVRFAPPSPRSLAVLGIARMLPSTRSWSSLTKKITFFCVPAGTGGGGGGGGDGGGGIMMPVTLVSGACITRLVGVSALVMQSPPADHLSGSFGVQVQDVHTLFLLAPA